MADSTRRRKITRRERDPTGRASGTQHRAGCEPTGSGQHLSVTPRANDSCIREGRSAAGLDQLD